MARKTSIEAFRQIEDEGLLSRLRFEVYKYLFTHGPCTAKEVTLALTRNKEGAGVYTTRLSELKNLGVVDEVGITVCKTTGRNVLLRDVNDKLPKKIKLSEYVKIRKKIEFHKRKIAELNMKLRSLNKEQKAEQLRLL